MSRTQIATSGLSDLGSPVATKVDVENALALYVTESNFSAAKATVSVAEFLLPGDSAADSGPVFQRAHDAVPAGTVLLIPARLDGNEYSMTTGVTISKAIKLISYSGVHVNGGITGFTVNATGACIEGLRLYGDRSNGNQGILLQGTKNHVTNCMFQDFDSGLVSGEGGSEHVVLGNRFYNSRTRAIWARTNGVGPFLIGNTSSNSIPPLVGGLHLQGSGTFVHMCDFIQGGVVIEPDTDEVDWNFFTQCSFDTNTTGDGLLIRNNTSYRVRGVYLTGCWSSTCQTSGIRTIGSGVIDEVIITAHIAKNNFAEAIRLEAGNNIQIDGCSLIGCSGSGVGAASTLYVSTPGYVQVRDGRFLSTGTGLNSTPAHHIELGTTAGGVDVDGTTFDLQTTGKVLFSAAPSGRLTVGRVMGASLETSGLTQILQGQTSVVVAHGLAVAPQKWQIMVTPNGQVGSGWWIDSIGASSFTIHCDSPVAGNVLFGWAATVKAV